MNEPTVPKVSDAYWFNWSKEHIDSSLERRDTALGTLQKLVIWLWGIYTTFAAVGFALSEKALDPITTAAIGAASVLLIAVYWASVWGQMPLSVEFDPRSPTEIREAHATIIQEKDRRLKITMLLSLIAAASVAIALLAAGAARPVEAPNLKVAVGNPISDNLHVTVDLAVTARVAADTRTTVDVTLNPGTKDARKEATRTFLSTKDGLVQVSLPVASTKRYQVRVAWVDKDIEYSMIHDLDLPGFKSP